jgi:hypothetical protein
VMTYDGTLARHYSAVLGRGATTPYCTISTKCSSYDVTSARYDSVIYLAEDLTVLVFINFGILDVQDAR